MKNQYFADVRDFGKCGMLSHLSGAPIIRNYDRIF